MKRLLITSFAAMMTLSAQAETPNSDLLSRGEQVAIASDCQACHTAPGSKNAFSGGYGIASPMGTIYSTNITPGTRGIGQYSEAEFSNAVRLGERADGAKLYPAMPYTSYSKMTDEDLHALYYYFMHGVKPVEQANQQTELPFPFNMRFSMTFWNLLFADKEPYQNDASQSAEWNRGNYLVNGLAHCNTCHTPRGVLMQEKSDQPLAGGPLGSWYAPNITSDPISGIGGWTNQELVQYLKTGRAEGKNQAAGGMAEAVENSLQYLPESDLNAIAVYLKSTAPIREEGETQPAYQYGKPMDVENSIRGRNPNNANHSLSNGDVLFSGNCASCHQPDGAGSVNQAYPSLFHNTATGMRNPNNLIAAILFGVQRKTADGDVLMPGFSSPSYVDKLTDQQIAEISNFVLHNYGNAEVRVTAGDVAWIRKGGHPPVLAQAQPWILPGIIVAMVVLLVVIVLWRRGRRSNIK
ncbi:cytochrome c [Pantoea sp. MQR6]|uniref:cytochrome c n=1 Tax=Pantoea sp. MQR6 TaxID=2907307 RepID=UPI001FAA9D57|nr:cytochrome c [Pantoea sp. MQR6]